MHGKSFSKGNYANIIFQSQSSMRMSYHDNDLSRFCFHSSYFSPHSFTSNKQIFPESFPHTCINSAETWNAKILRVSHFIKNDFSCKPQRKAYVFLPRWSPIIYFNSYLFLFYRIHSHTTIMLNFTHNKSLIWNHYNLYEHVNEIEEIVWCWYDVIVSLIFSDSHDAITPCIMREREIECCRDDGYVDEYFESD